MTTTGMPPRIGGALCLDFANTLELRGSPEERDALQSFEDLLQWCRQSGAVADDAAERLRARAAADERAAQKFLVRARLLRGTIYGVFSAIADGCTPKEDQIGGLNAELGSLIARSRILIEQGGARRVWSGQPNAYEQLLWQIAWSAFDLLLSGELRWVRECANDECRWLFVDRSRNRSRRWCDMATCGNVMKVRRFRQKSQSPAT